MDALLAPFIFPTQHVAAPATPLRPIALSAPSPVGAARKFAEPTVEVGSSEGLNVDHATPRLPVDVVETPSAFFLRFDVAGVDKEAIQVDVGARTRDLRVTVHRLSGKAAAAEELARGASFIVAERPMGSSARRIVFPANADLAGDIETHLADGMLSVRVNKTSAQPRSVRRVPVI